MMINYILIAALITGVFSIKSCDVIGQEYCQIAWDMYPTHKVDRHYCNRLLILEKCFLTLFLQCRNIYHNYYVRNCNDGVRMGVSSSSHAKIVESSLLILMILVTFTGV
ncbi:uncharacterized protein LOC128249788 [Octopus bimaculoides]|uniref:uncharacterized protein LOC128249788 n=1 Tax=Octopus bimaculoides TaxID=37653 RepID=UPI0022E5A323|nr:uncharacterized protein LOC128249788 [Octopus bimaculoides]